jgi:hypothetical protein
MHACTAPRKPTNLSRDETARAAAARLVHGAAGGADQTHRSTAGAGQVARHGVTSDLPGPMRDFRVPSSQAGHARRHARVRLDRVLELEGPRKNVTCLLRPPPEAEACPSVAAPEIVRMFVRFWRSRVGGSRTNMASVRTPRSVRGAPARPGLVRNSCSRPAVSSSRSVRK